MKIKKSTIIVIIVFIIALLVTILCTKVHATEPPIIKKDTVFTPTDYYSYKQDFACTLLELWDEYKVYCYNDSTAEYFWTYCDLGCWDVPCIKGDTNWLGDKCPEHWKHRQPEFTDFMQWLKNNYYDLVTTK